MNPKPSFPRPSTITSGRRPRVRSIPRWRSSMSESPTARIRRGSSADPIRTAGNTSDTEVVGTTTDTEVVVAVVGTTTDTEVVVAVVGTTTDTEVVVATGASGSSGTTLGSAAPTVVETPVAPASPVGGGTRVVAVVAGFRTAGAKVTGAGPTSRSSVTCSSGWPRESFPDTRASGSVRAPATFRRQPSGWVPAHLAAASGASRLASTSTATARRRRRAASRRGLLAEPVIGREE